MTHPAPTKPELLAPAGSIESFHAAVEAGADAVYLGLNDFNARLRAENFTIKTVSYLLPYAHARGVKLYIALNTLFKQAEIEKLSHTLYQLDQIGVDALIVADIGLCAIARAYFPRLALHASTQMAIHNAPGVRAAEKLGFRRVILSRETTLAQIRTLNKNTRLELEIFVHGALCYGVSGLCLASSYGGGSSGNRGRCTQVCRRPFKSGTASGYFYSPRDLAALSLLPHLVDSGVSSLKIEGRMKSADYTYSVVKAFRTALDSPGQPARGSPQEIRDFGRKKTSGFLGSESGRGIINAASQSGIGEKIGIITAIRQNVLVIDTAAELAANDRIRIQPENGFDGESATIKASVRETSGLVVTLNKAVPCSTGDVVFLTSRPAENAPYLRIRGVPDTVPVPFKPFCPFADKIHEAFSTGQPSSAVQPRETLWVKINDVRWLELLHATPCQRLILGGEAASMLSFINDSARLKPWRSRLYGALPAYIPETECHVWKKIITAFASSGITSWFCPNIGHREFFPSGCRLVAGAPPLSFNLASQQSLQALGFSSFIYSLEDDYLNIKATASPHGIVTLFSLVPLFISRIHPAVKTGNTVIDSDEERFITAHENGLHYLIAEKPLCLTHRKPKLAVLGIRNFVMDLSFCEPDLTMLHTLMDCYKNGTRLPGSGVFNFKAGLK